MITTLLFLTALPLAMSHYETLENRGQASVWPFPQKHEKPTPNYYMVLNPHDFKFKVVGGHTCDILDAAMDRYHDLIFYPVGAVDRLMNNYANSKRTWEADKNYRGYLKYVSVNLTQPCEKYPYLGMDEKYSLQVNNGTSVNVGSISSSSIWGILRGLETFSQLVYMKNTDIWFQINPVSIVDYPRFAHRGIMLDSSRNFLSMKVLKKSIDLMAQNKLNVFHWHLMDDPSFPYISKLFPELTKGAFDQRRAIYTPADVQEIVEYARMRGIRVIPEFDTLGHTKSWNVEAILTKCSPAGVGPVDPTSETTYDILGKFFGEVSNAFPDAYVHLGGDAVDSNCWASNRNVTAFMTKNGFEKDYKKLERYYMQRLINVTRQARQAVVWQQVVGDGTTLPLDTVVQVSTGDQKNYKMQLENLTKNGYKVLLTSPWDLSKASVYDVFANYYNANPTDFNGTDAQKQLVIGGEGVMWGDNTDDMSVIQRTFSPALAIALRLWSNQTGEWDQIGVWKNVPKSTNQVLQAQRCRLMRRGFDIDPVNNSDYCDLDF